MKKICLFYQHHKLRPPKWSQCWVNTFLKQLQRNINIIALLKVGFIGVCFIWLNYFFIQLGLVFVSCASVDVNIYSGSKQGKQVNLTALFVHIPPAVPEHMICSTLFLLVHTQREADVDVAFLEWVIVDDRAGSYLVEPCSELFICEPCVYWGRKVEALGGRKEAGY